MNRILICNIIPNDLVHLLKAPQASNNFCFSLIQNNCFDKVQSIVPITYCDERIKSDDRVSYFNVKKSKSKIKSVIQILTANIQCAVSSKNSDAIWFYNIVNANILCYLLLRYIYRKNVYVILLDHTPCRNKLSLQYYIPYLIKHSKGIISLSLRTDIIHTNMDYIAGIIPLSQIQNNTSPIKDKLTFLFSGVLSQHTGIDMAIKVFKQLPEYELLITGIGDLKAYDMQNYSNIRFLGFLSYNEYLDLYKKVDVCLSFRNPAFDENRNNFPSKILEYLSYSRIVLSTIEYPELQGFSYFTSNFDEDSIINTIHNINKKPRHELTEISNNKLQLMNAFSAERWLLGFNKIEIE